MKSKKGFIIPIPYTAKTNNNLLWLMLKLELPLMNAPIGWNERYIEYKFNLSHSLKVELNPYYLTYNILRLKD